MYALEVTVWHAPLTRFLSRSRAPRSVRIDAGTDGEYEALRAAMDSWDTSPPVPLDHEVAERWTRETGGEARVDLVLLAPSVALRPRALRAHLARRALVVIVLDLVSQPDSLAETLIAMSREGLPIKRMQLVHERTDDPAIAALLEGKVGRPGGLVIEPPACAEIDPATPDFSLSGQGRAV